MIETGTANRQTPFPLFLIVFIGRIGPARYFAGIAVAIMVLLAAFGLAAGAMAPTGAGRSAWLAIPLFALFVWIVMAVTAQRLRDAGKPPALALAFVLGPVLLLFPGLELIEYAGMLLALMFVGFLAAPGFLKPKPNDEVAAPR